MFVMLNMIKLPHTSQSYIAQAYSTGLSSIVLPKVKVEKKSIFNTKYGSSSNSNVFDITSKTGSKVRCYSDSCVSEGEVECIVCPKRFDIEHNTGIIVSIEYGEDDEIIVNRTLVTCSHNCSARYLIEEEKKGSNMRSEFKRSLSYHRLMFIMQHPGCGPLLPSPDPSLLRIHGGSMELEEWSKEGLGLIRTPVMKVVNMKSIHMNK